jgi:hypothetical protein
MMGIRGKANVYHLLAAESYFIQVLDHQAVPPRTSNCDVDDVIYSLTPATHKSPAHEIKPTAVKAISQSDPSRSVGSGGESQKLSGCKPSKE